MNKYLIISIVLFLLAIWAFLIEPNLLVVKKYRINLPILKTMKIVFVSDFHIAKHDKKRLARIVNKINSLNPDLVISGGDYIKGHDGSKTLNIETQAEELKKIKAPFITVLGNHDGWYDKEYVEKTLTESGFTVLANSSTKFNGLYIAGVEDLQTGFPNAAKALENTSSPRILVTHTPDIYYDVNEDVELILAGHTHGGQVSFPIIGAPIVPSKYGSKFARGKIYETKNKMIITKGLGTSILSLRFCSLPEIVVLESE